MGQKERETAHSFFNALFQALLKISSWIIAILPIGIAAFTAQFVQSVCQGKEMGAITYYTTSVILANLIQGFIVLPLLLKYRGISPNGSLSRNATGTIRGIFFQNPQMQRFPSH